MADKAAENKTANDNGGVPAKGQPEFVVRDALDQGVPMLPGSSDEPQGPEDALGAGVTRGDYSGRIGPSNYQPHTVESAGRREDGTVIPEVKFQRDFVEQGQVDEGRKGGVDNA